MLYPDELIRGIANASDELAPEGNASLNMFVFRKNPDRGDDTIEELSVNWCDDKEKAVAVIMGQLKPNGNMICKSGLSKQTKTVIRAMLVPCVTSIVSREDG